MISRNRLNQIIESNSPPIPKSAKKNPVANHRQMQLAAEDFSSGTNVSLITDYEPTASYGDYLH